MLRSEQKNIDGTTYEVTVLPAKASQRLMVRLFRIAGPALVPVLEKAVKSAVGKVPKSKEGQDEEAIGKAVLEVLLATDLDLKGAVEHLAANASEDDIEYITDTLARSTKINSGGSEWPSLFDVMEIKFAGNWLTWMKWLGFALKVNYMVFSKGQSNAEG